jgi:hypothetical protein
MRSGELYPAGMVECSTGIRWTQVSVRKSLRIIFFVRVDGRVRPVTGCE